MGGAPAITPDSYLAALTRFGINWRFYKDRADWLVHNRNFRNTDLVAGGWAPVGVGVHNTASTAQAGMLTYLYNGDAARGLPGPLANAGVLKTGECVLLGWGTSNATGPGDPIGVSAVRAGTMPMTRELVPTTSGPTDPRAVRVAPYLFGIEACYASEGPTDVQADVMLRYTAACLYAMGKGAGSVVMHRELTTTRSDPQGWPRDGSFRRRVAALLASPTSPLEDDMNLSDPIGGGFTVQDALNRIMGGIPPGPALQKDPLGEPRRVADNADVGVVADLVRGVAVKVGAPVDVDEAAIASGVAAQLLPAVRDAIVAELDKGTSPDNIADAVVASLGARLSPPPTP